MQKYNEEITPSEEKECEKYIEKLLNESLTTTDDEIHIIPQEIQVITTTNKDDHRVEEDADVLSSNKVASSDTTF